MFGFGFAAVAAEISVGAIPLHAWVAPGEPVAVRVWIENTGAEQVALDAHSDPRCFAATWLDLAVAPTLELVAWEYDHGMQLRVFGPDAR